MKCAICDNKISTYATYCRRCSSRVRTYGTEGTKWLYKLIYSNRDTSREEINEFIKKYYIGKMIDNNNIFQSIYKSIMKAGYTGNVDGYPYEYDMTMRRIRIRELRKAERLGVKKTSCEICGTSVGELYMHHIVPVSLGGLSTPDNIITLCSKCHKRVHKELRLELVNYYRNNYKQITSIAKRSLAKTTRERSVTNGTK